VTLPRRSPALPDVPTIAEAGMPEFKLSSWAAVFGPKGLPRPIVDRLNKEFNLAATRPEVVNTLQKQAFQAVGSTPEELATLVREQFEAYKNTLKIAGVEPD
jgi:tripartite-type tricarboxylate transporter receptor subunit TctC